MAFFLQWSIAILTFLAELALWAGVGRAIWRIILPINSKLALTMGILGTIIVIVFWSFFLAPRADNRISLLPRIVLISVMTLITGFILYSYGDKTYGLILMIPLTIVQAVGQYIMNKM